jgi:hypothetical protein
MSLAATPVSSLYHAWPRDAGLAPSAPHPHEPCDDVEPMHDYENVLTAEKQRRSPEKQALIAG